MRKRFIFNFLFQRVLINFDRWPMKALLFYFGQCLPYQLSYINKWHVLQNHLLFLFFTIKYFAKIIFRGVEDRFHDISFFLSTISISVKSKKVIFRNLLPTQYLSNFAKKFLCQGTKIKIWRMVVKFTNEDFISYIINM